MNASEILNYLDRKGVELWAEDMKLRVRTTKGELSRELQSEIAKNKDEILLLLRHVDVDSACSANEGELSPQTIGHLIRGSSSEDDDRGKIPILNPDAMAKRVRVTFRPLPNGYDNYTIANFRRSLKELLSKQGVNVISWEQATKQYSYVLRVPVFNWRIKLRTKVVSSDIDAVIDVERPKTAVQRFKSFIAEQFYKIYTALFARGKDLSIATTVLIVGWAEEHAAKYVEDPTNTQVIALTALDETFTSKNIKYSDKIGIGINTLIKTFSEIVIGISESKISILNMNLSDSIFPKHKIEYFVSKSLIPKIYVPIAPLLMNQFKVSTYNALNSESAEKLVSLGTGMARTGLLPDGFNLSKTIKRKSYRDIVNVIVNGRTGVSYGFVAYIEPPQYVGDIEISSHEWNSLAPVDGVSSNELRENRIGRRYVKVKIGDELCFRQIPDIWLVSSRSGSSKTSLDIKTDVLRVGLTDCLELMIPDTVDSSRRDIKPSYDIYVMLSIALASAIYLPQLVVSGAPIVHFHGYPSDKWFKFGEHFSGNLNPSVPCGTYESGVFNFLSIKDISTRELSDVRLLGLIEPDHGTNIVACDVDYLIERLVDGSRKSEVNLGGKHFNSLLQERF